MELKDLKANPKNPRKVTPAKLKALKRSLEEFGDLGGFVFNRRSGMLVGGHQRAKVFPKNAKVVIEQSHATATEKGTIAAGYVEIKGERFSYREVDWDEDREKAANIAANKGAGEWDPANLGDWFKDLAAHGFDLDLTMFDASEREAFLKDPEQAGTEGLTDPDEIPEEVETRCKPGDLWILGNHRLLCGDSTDVLCVEKLMGGQKADMVFTDPPYGIDVVGAGKSVGSVGAGNVVKANIYSPIIGDETTNTAREFYATCHAVGMLNYVIWGGNYFTDFLPPKKCWIVWDKKGRAWEDNFSDFEMAWTSFDKPAKIITHVWMGMIQAGEREARVHPTQKPSELVVSCLAYLPESKSIYDGFLGSGSTLIACEKTNRTCYGMELDPKYCDVILARWEKFTGKNAVLSVENSV